jgi:hypothetical protein
MHKKMLGAAAALLVMFASASALAGDDDVATPSQDGDGDYGYEFKDDLLAAGFAGPGGGVIKLRSGAIRRTLIRPRTSFVPEMLKSVETL